MLTLKDFKIVARENFTQDMINNTYPNITELLVHDEIWWIECYDEGFFVDDGFMGVRTPNLIHAMKYLYSLIEKEKGKEEVSYLKEFEYSVPTVGLSASFDYGSVWANDAAEASAKALEKIKKDLENVNRLIAGYAHIEIDLSELKVEELK